MGVLVASAGVLRSFDHHGVIYENVQIFRHHELRSGGGEGGRKRESEREEVGLRVVHDCVNSWTSEPCRARRLSFMHQVWQSREKKGENEIKRKSAVSRGNTLAGIDARAMGITRVQINFGES